MPNWTPSETVQRLASLKEGQVVTDLQRTFREGVADIHTKSVAGGVGPASGGNQKAVADLAERLLSNAGVELGSTLLELTSTDGHLPTGGDDWVLNRVDQTLDSAVAAFENIYPLPGGGTPHRAFVERLHRARASTRTSVELAVGKRRLKQETGALPVPVPLEVVEPDDLKVKRWEELLALVKLGHEHAQSRWESVEEKTTKYATLLGVVLAASAVGFGEVAQIVGTQRDWLHTLFVASYGAVAVFGVLAFVCLLLALRVQSVLYPPLNRQLLGHVASHNYVDVLYSMSIRFVESTENLNQGHETKSRWAARGFYGLQVVLVCAIISSAAYVALKARDEMTKNSASSQGTPTIAVAPVPAKPSPSSPNPNVSAPAGETFKKGIEGGGQPRATDHPPRK